MPCCADSRLKVRGGLGCYWFNHQEKIRNKLGHLITNYLRKVAKWPTGQTVLYRAAPVWTVYNWVRVQQGISIKENIVLSKT